MGSQEITDEWYKNFPHAMNPLEKLRPKGQGPIFVEFLDTKNHLDDSLWDGLRDLDTWVLGAI